MAGYTVGTVGEYSGATYSIILSDYYSSNNTLIIIDANGGTLTLEDGSTGTGTF